MAKNNRDNKRGLGRGLDSLIPKIDDVGEEKSEKSSLTLEDILSNSEEEENKTENTASEKEKEKIEEKIEEEKKELTKKIGEIEEEVARKEEDIDTITEELVEEKAIEDSIEKDGQKTEKSEKPEEELEEEKVLSDYELASIEEVKEIIEKNPRITLWSTKSSAVFRYLRKTRPEFSISKEASELIDQAVSEKYPEIWKLFEDL